MVRRKTDEEFKSEVEVLTGGAYRPLTEYTRTKDKVTMEHITCGNIWDVTPVNFLNGTRCPRCSGMKKTKTTEEFMEEVSTITGGKLELIGEYVGCDVYTTVRCTLHDIEIETRPTSIVRGKTICKLCNAEYLSKAQRKPVDDVKSQLHDKHKGKIVMLGDYTNSHTKTLFMCKDCGTEFNAEPNSVTRISGCPGCNISKGEELLANLLTEYEIPFLSEYRFTDCVDDRQLPFDFFIPDIDVLIEYDGEQHYRPIDFFGGEQAYLSQLKRDSIKTKYAKDTNRDLIRIPYDMSECHIRDILQEVKRRLY